MRSLLFGVLLLGAWLADQYGQTPEDRFASEPQRPKAEAPLRFGKSWDQALAESKRTGRRILAVFTGEHCGWCRVLEKRTFTDAEVVGRSASFICVELNAGDEALARVVDLYRVESIPRSLVLTPEGQVVTQRTGYIPATEYAAWLKEARTKTVPPAQGKAPGIIMPPAVGAAASEADVVIWSVDSSRSVERWGDDDWTGHVELLRLLRAAGLRPRVEHVARERFPNRWEQATAANRVPELLIADQWAGLVRDLNRQGRFLRLASERLTWTPENASCHDFAKRFGFLVVGSRHEDAARRAASEILRPGPQTELPGLVLSDTQGRAEAAAVARRAAVAFLAGDPVGLEAVASAASPQLSRCVAPEPFRQGTDVIVDSVEVHGQGHAAFARVEVRTRGKTALGADAVLLVLDRETSGWKAFTVTSDILTLRELPVLCSLPLVESTEARDVPAPRRLAPEEGGRMGVTGRGFTWDAADGGQPLAAQVCQVLLNGEPDRSWPETRFKVYPGAARSRSLQWSGEAKELTGLTAAQMFWCVWSIGRDGRIRASDVGSYRRAEFKY